MRNLLFSFLILFGCSGSNKYTEMETHGSTIIYATADGNMLWSIKNGLLSSGIGGRIIAEDYDNPSIIYQKTKDARCVSLPWQEQFGMPLLMMEGSEFNCPSSRGKIYKCYDEVCNFGLIIAQVWRGDPKKPVGVDVSYWFSRCRGITSIALLAPENLMVQFGSTLDLRTKYGLLADSDSEECRNKIG